MYLGILQINAMLNVYSFWWITIPKIRIHIGWENTQIDYAPIDTYDSVRKIGSLKHYNLSNASLRTVWRYNKLNYNDAELEQWFMIRAGSM